MNEGRRAQSEDPSFQSLSIVNCQLSIDAGPSGTEWMARAAVFGLAFLSFACLLGTFYRFWPMHQFACGVLPLATLALIVIAWRSPGRDFHSARTWILEGTWGGLIAAVFYDLYRVPFVLTGTPLFKVFPKFGQLILDEAGTPTWTAHLLGWTYHFSNGAALGIMFLCLVPRPHRRLLFWGGITWALWVEAMLLLTPYPEFFGLHRGHWFLFLTASAHLIFGVTLGTWFSRRLAVR